MKYSITLLLLFLSCIIAMHCNGNSVENHDDGGADTDVDTDSDAGSDLPPGLSLEWAIRAGGQNWSTAESISYVTNDVFFLTGYMRGTATFDDGLFEFSSYGEEDTYIAKFLSDGTTEWVVQGGGIARDEGIDVIRLSDGSTVATGFFEDEAIFGKDHNFVSLESYGGRDMFVVKYSPNGNLDWAASGAGELREEGTGVAAMTDGSVVVAGIFDSQTRFGKGDNETILESADEKSIFLSKYSAAGTLSWARRVAHGMDEISSGRLISLADNALVLLGGFAGEAVFGEGQNEKTVTANEKTDGFIAKYNADASLDWIQTSSQIRARAAVGLSDSSIVVASSGETIVEKIDVEGTSLWNKRPLRVSPDGYYGATTISSLQDGSVIVAGDFSATLLFGEGDNEEEVIPEESTDMFIAKYGPNGDFAWVERTRCKNTDMGNDDAFMIFAKGLAIQDDTWIYVTGYFKDQAVFGKGNNEVILESEGGYDIFIAKYKINGK